MKTAEEYNKQGLESATENKLYKAIAYFRKAIRLDPKFAEAYINLGAAFQSQGKLTKAVISFQKALKIDRHQEVAHYNLATIFQKQGKLKKSITFFKQVLKINPEDYEAHNNLGIVLSSQNRLEEAIASFKRAVEINPYYQDAHFNLGIALTKKNDVDQAILHYQRALEIKPDLVDANNNLGNLLKNQGKLDQAIVCFKNVLAKEPNNTAAYNNLGDVYQIQGKLVKATALLKRAVSINPQYKTGYNNLGVVLSKQGKLSEAIACFKKALKLDPSFAKAPFNLGVAFQNLNKPTQAIASYKKAVKINPYQDNAHAYANLVYQLQIVCDWREIKKFSSKLDQLISVGLKKNNQSVLDPFIAIARDEDPQQNFNVARLHSRDVKNRLAFSQPPFNFILRRRSRDKIKVGYLSDDFRDHAVGHQINGLFKLHNRDQFTIYTYSYGSDDYSQYRANIVNHSDYFVDITSLSYLDAAKRIYDDKVDILIDLKGHTQNNRLEISALRPAPIQVTWLGFPGTTGADFFDYIITDKIVSPKSHSQFYSEKLVHMPHSYQIYDHEQPISNDPLKRIDFGLPKEAFVFCSFATSFKIEPVMFDVWMRILKTAPGSVLWLLLNNATVEPNLKREAKVRGINPKRLIFAQKSPKDLHLARHRLADLGLNTRIYGGHITTSDCLWAGVPVVTLCGKHFASRVASSILTASGLPELVTHNLKDYEKLAIHLAKDPKKLKKIKEKLTKNRLTKPFFDTPRFVKNLEKAYQKMWNIYFTGRKPRQISIKEYAKSS